MNEDAGEVLPTILMSSHELAERNQPVVYCVDAADRIDSVNEAWARLAIENDAASLSDGVIGTLLWDHVAGSDVEQVYRDLLDRVRIKQVPATFPFRCDSPNVYRNMRLAVIPLEKDRIEFRAILTSSGPHARTMDLLRPHAEAESVPMVRMCAWCKAIAIDGAWRPLEVAVEEASLLLEEPFPTLTHGICDVCAVEYSKYGL